MKTTDNGKPIGWRERLHSLPSGTEPTSTLAAWLIRALLCVVLFLVGSIFVILSGTFTGLSRGIGPEQTGGSLYVLIGLILNLLVGGAIAAFIARRSAHRATPRLVFYSFTAPAFLAVILMVLSLLGHLFR